MGSIGDALTTGGNAELHSNINANAQAASKSNYSGGVVLDIKNFSSISKITRVI